MFRSLVVSLLALSLAAVPALSAKAPKAPPPAPSLLDGVEIFGIDTPHSEIGFSVLWMGISRVHGSFDDFLGSIAYDAKDPTRSSVMIVIRTNSIHTGFERRDKDLKSANFFDVEKFPNITFSSRSIEKQGDGYLVRGPLTIHGVTKEVEVPMTFNGEMHDSRHDHRIGFEGHLKLNRKDYGVVGPAPMNALLDKGIVIGEQVDIPLAFEGWKATPRDTLSDRTSDSLYRQVLARGVEPVAKQFRALRAKTVDSLMVVDEGTINNVGYQLLSQGRPTEAVEVFQLEVVTWPDKVFGYVGLGQTYAVLGNRERAVATLEKAVSITPEAPRAQVILKRLRG